MLTLQAHAKINLALQVLGKRQDGYHEIDSIMQSVSLCDYVSLSRINNGIELTSDSPLVPLDNKNIAYKAAEIFFDKIGVSPSIKIDIKKNIPIAAGLAGGSADAAAVLIGLNQLYQAKLSEFDLSVLGAEVGSDVPFCLVGGMCRCRGRGELVEKIIVPSPQSPAPNPKSPVPSPSTFYIIVKPDFPVSTKLVYAVFDEMTNDKLKRTNEVSKNDLELVVIPKYPEISKIKKQLIELGCSYSQMSGSGPSVFGLAPDEQTATRIYNKMKIEYRQTFLVEPVDRGVTV